MPWLKQVWAWVCMQWLPSEAAWIKSTQCTDEAKCKKTDVLACYPGRACPALGIAATMDGLKTTSVDIVKTFQQRIVYDLGEAHRLEAYSVLGDDTQGCVRATQLQYAKALDAPDSQWYDSGPDLDVIKQSPETKSDPIVSTSRRFDPPIIARFWRLVIRGNYNSALPYSVVSEVQVCNAYCHIAVMHLPHARSARMSRQMFNSGGWCLAAVHVPT